MKTSQRGWPLPESWEDFKLLLENRTAHAEVCGVCSRPFGPRNTHSPAGWRDTQIVGYCEDCYDALFSDDDPDNDRPTDDLDFL